MGEVKNETPNGFEHSLRREIKSREINWLKKDDQLFTQAIEKKKAVVSSNGAIILDIDENQLSEKDLKEYAEYSDSVFEKLVTQLPLKNKPEINAIVFAPTNPAMGIPAGAASITEYKTDDDLQKLSLTVVVEKDVMRTIYFDQIQSARDPESFLNRLIKNTLKHEMTHAIVRQFCIENGIDLDKSDLFMFSEPLSVFNETKENQEILQDLVREDLKLDLIPPDYPQWFDYSVMYNSLPSFFHYLANKTGDGDFPFHAFIELSKQRRANYIPTQDLIPEDAFLRLRKYDALSNKAIKSGIIADIVDEPLDLNQHANQVIGHIHARIIDMRLKSDIITDTTPFAAMDGKSISKEIYSDLDKYLYEKHKLHLIEEWRNWRISFASE
jgi:hypothetical protein